MNIYFSNSQVTTVIGEPNEPIFINEEGSTVVIDITPKVPTEPVRVDTISVINCGELESSAPSSSSQTSLPPSSSSIPSSSSVTSVGKCYIDLFRNILQYYLLVMVADCCNEYNVIPCRCLCGE